tara:strand:- start:1004 stop:1213 length:210 start_codon:yes stop_codon:yes gene_type:complete
LFRIAFIYLDKYYPTMELDTEDRKELEELKKEIKNIADNNELEIDFNLLAELEYDLNNLTKKIKNENKN